MVPMDEAEWTGKLAPGLALAMESGESHERIRWLPVWSIQVLGGGLAGRRSLLPLHSMPKEIWNGLHGECEDQRLAVVLRWPFSADYRVRTLARLVQCVLRAVVVLRCMRVRMPTPMTFGSGWADSMAIWTSQSPVMSGPHRKPVGTTSKAASRSSKHATRPDAGWVSRTGDSDVAPIAIPSGYLLPER